MAKASLLNIHGISRWVSESDDKGNCTAAVTVTAPSESNTQMTAGQKLFPAAFKVLIDNIKHLFSNKQNNIIAGDSAGHVILDTTVEGTVGKTTGTLAIVGNALTVGTATTNTGAVTIQSAGTSATTISGPDNGTAVLTAGTMEIIGNKATVLTDTTSDTKYPTVKAVVTGLNTKQDTLSGTGFVKLEGTTLTYVTSTYILPAATDAILGGVKVTIGNGLGNSSGTISMSSFTGASASDNGTSGAVKQPVIGDQVKFLKGDGNWTVIALSDLPSGVQTSLGKADTALQSHQNLSGKQNATTTGDNGKVLLGGSTAGSFGTSRSITTSVTSSSTDLITSGGVYSHTSDTGVHVSSTEKTTWNGKQAALSGNGFVKINTSGTISYDNNTYLTSVSKATSSVLGGILVSATEQTTGANSVTSTASRSYAVQLTSTGVAVVNVPWVDTDTNTTYGIQADKGLELNSNNFGVKTGGADTKTTSTLKLYVKADSGGLYVELGSIDDDVNKRYLGYVYP